MLWCTVARPEARNSLTPDAYEAIGAACGAVDNDPQLHAMALTGIDDVFITGGDMSDVHDAVTTPFQAMRDCQGIVLAAVNGICQAAGVVFTLLADIAIASDKATFRLPELRRGVPNTWYATYLPAHIGLARAKELVLTGRRIDAEEALSIGLVARVVPHSELRAAVIETLNQTLLSAPLARATWKRAMHAAIGPVDEATMHASFTSAEAREGFAAFMEKRPPSWAPAGEDTSPSSNVPVPTN